MINTREWDLRARSNLEIYNKPGNEKQRVSAISRGPVSLCPVPDEDNIYFRMHRNETTLSKTDEQIPSRDFLMSSYPWKNLLSPALVRDLRSSLKETSKQINSLIDLLVEDEIKTRKLSQSTYSELIIDICHVGIMRDPGKVYRDFIKIADLKALFQDANVLASAAESESFDFIAFKIASVCDLAQKGNESTQSNSPLNQLFTNNSTSFQVKHAQRTYVVFIDSLDLSIMKDAKFSNDLPTLCEVFNRSIHYKNFTASGHWTFPCLHSMHTGIPPYMAFSSFPTRHDPILRCMNQIALSNISTINRDPRNNYILSSLLAKDSMMDSDSYLTRRLARYGHSVAAVKSSRNHGWRYGLTHSTHQTFENCSMDMIPLSLDYLLKATDNSRPATFFIDIDALHRRDYSLSQSSNVEHINYLDWLESAPSKLERLVGDCNDETLALKRYKHKLLKMEDILKKITSRMTDDDNLILFSDHGSGEIEISPAPYKKVKYSTLSAKKIWKPTLLVYAPKLPSFKGHHISNELVSTVDLYSIILNINKIDDGIDYKYSILPPSLGGNNSRSAAYSFGESLYYDERGEALPIIFELIERFDNNHGSSHSQPFAPIESADSIEGLLREMFPNARSLFTRSQRQEAEPRFLEVF